jgi:ketosteroid isomerase-like protein
MKRILIMMLLMMATASLSQGQTPDRKADPSLPPGMRAAQGISVRQEVAQLERDSAVASQKGDVERLQLFFADGYVHTDSRGEVITKEQALGYIKSGNLTYESIELDLVEVHVFGQTAVLTARASIKGRSRGQNSSGVYRLTRVYVRLQGRWQAVAGHSSLIPGQ